MTYRQAQGAWLYDLILYLFAPLLDLFFREIQVKGPWRVPAKGAIILVAAPHANQFVDSLVLMRIMRSVRRRVSWLMAAKSFKEPVVGTLANGIGALPVARSMDVVKKAKGRVYLAIDSDSHSRLLRGIGTTFDDPSFEVGGNLHVKVGVQTVKLEILAINGANELLIKRSPGGEVEQTLKDCNGFEYSVSPKIDQAAVYEAVFDRLSMDGCVGIFPEGGSHDRTDLLSLQAGAAVMALGALSQGINVSMVPVGLTYFHRHKFRSSAIVEFGDPVAVTADEVEKFSKGQRRESIGSLLATLRQSLAAVTMTAPDFETMVTVRMARRLYTSYEKRIPQPASTEIYRRLIKGYTQHAQDAEIIQLSKSIKQYSQQLTQLGLHDHQVDYARLSAMRILGMLLSRTVKLFWLFMGTLPGLLLFSPIFVAARYYSHNKRRQALAASSVKVHAHDVVATWKILIATGLAPLLYTYYVLILVAWAKYNHINSFLPPTIPTYMVVIAAYTIFPTITYAALRLGEVGMDILKSLRPLVLCLSSKSDVLRDLKRKRADLARHVTDVVDRLGPDMFPDCEHEAVPFPRRIYADISPFESLDELMGKSVLL